MNGAAVRPAHALYPFPFPILQVTVAANVLRRNVWSTSRRTQLRILHRARCEFHSLSVFLVCASCCPKECLSLSNSVQLLALDRAVGLFYANYVLKGSASPPGDVPCVLFQCEACASIYVLGAGEASPADQHADGGSQQAASRIAGCCLCE